MQRVHQTAADKQKAYRDRTKVLATAVDEFRSELEMACERADSKALTDNLPEEPTAMLIELTTRLKALRIIAAKSTSTRKRKYRRRTCPHCHGSLATKATSDLQSEAGTSLVSPAA